MKFLVPIKIKPPDGYSQQTWDIKPDDQALLQAQLPTGLPLCHDLTPINEPNDAPNGENVDLDMLAANMVDEYVEIDDMLAANMVDE